jgi:hypothetical protein
VVYRTAAGGGAKIVDKFNETTKVDPENRTVV